MMAHLSFGKKKFEALDDKAKEEFKVRFDKLGEIRTELSTLVDKDTESFNEFMKELAECKVDTEAKMEDIIISGLITNAPKQVIIHHKENCLNTEFIDTIVNAVSYTHLI